MGPDRRHADETGMVGRTTIRDTTALPIFMSSRTRSRHGSVLMVVAALAVIVAAIVLRIV